MQTFPPMAPYLTRCHPAPPPARPVLLDDPGRTTNPYWDEVRLGPYDETAAWSNYWAPERYATDDPVERAYRSRRSVLVRRYSWAVPDPRVLAFVAAACTGPVVEIGAGTGYWAWQLSQLGVTVVAFDADPPDLRRNGWHTAVGGTGAPVLQDTWHPVAPGGPEVLAGRDEPVLLLGWPPMSPMAVDTLTAFRGDRVVYVGEAPGGCTADRAFFAALAAGWTRTGRQRPVRWPDIFDRASVWDRRPVEQGELAAKS